MKPARGGDKTSIPEEWMKPASTCLNDATLPTVDGDCAFTCRNDTFDNNGTSFNGSRQLKRRPLSSHLSGGLRSEKNDCRTHPNA
jgi:hypothetical protein